MVRYRHNSKPRGYHFPYPLMDVQRAMRYARKKMDEIHKDSSIVGIMDFSAGGHLASSASTHFDKGNPLSVDPIERITCRPDFSILIYPVITFTLPFMHKGSRNNFIGPLGDTALVHEFSNENKVTTGTPPTFIVHAADDKAVPVRNSLVYAEALTQNNIPFELHILPSGGHGFGMGKGKPEIGRWVDYLEDWLKFY